MEGVQNNNENSRVVGVIFVVKKMEIPGRRGTYMLVSSLCGGEMDIFWNCT